MAASAELLMSALAPLPRQRTHRKRGHEPVDLSGVSHPDSGLDGSCTCGCAEAPLTSEPPLADVAPLTSEPPLAEAPLTSEPAGAGFGTEPAEI
ncbi:hypothetical protein [Streptomyces iconiensis]|uniref:Uncharacterized protein n=1 Tax=Streptomyces iconiensis TaxID=1384038 RepID=A0ABT7A5H3_9ACTN|nr:hypothetical protein [Streptomyces iconiensis]MDJ1136597.1 hypothetical protein [Streptomyces iconiensis]